MIATSLQPQFLSVMLKAIDAEPNKVVYAYVVEFLLSSLQFMRL